jgi:aspartyl-tRNA(Asn)/glutamyl-tRNA(Gln) amidotransferase subunit B
MRADVNLSVREYGAEEFGTRTEMKNLNSFKAIARAIEAETERQIDLLEDGKKVVQETRRWDDDEEYSYPMRSKEDAQDYRYFPDPDLVPVVISDEWLQEVKDRQPELRDDKMIRYEEEFGLPEYDIEILTGTKHMADLFEATNAIVNKPKEVSNWLMGETMRLVKEQNIDMEEISFSPEHLAKLIQMIDAGEINRKVGKQVFEEIFKKDVEPAAYVEEHGLKSMNDEGALRATIEEIVANNPQSVEDYNAGKKKAIGFLVGQTMRATKGKADPGMVNKILAEILNK